MAKAAGAADGAGNRSIRRTKRALRDSLIELMKTRSILRISVTEICDAADVGRSTFYAHYKDQFALLRELEDEAFEGLEALHHRQIERITRLTDERDVKRAVEEMLEYIDRNGDSIQVLLSENGDQNFSRRFFRVGIDRMRDFLKKTGAPSPAKPADEHLYRYMAHFATGGFLTLIQEWLKNGMDTPAPEIARLLAKLARGVLE